MFTGIVEETGAVVAATSTRLTIRARTVLEGTRLGDSIAIDGTCLTVTALGPSQFTVGVQPETLRRTTLANARPGQHVNLERAIAIGGRLGGHFVQGHVDGTAKLTSIQPDREARILAFAVAPSLARYIVEKGFVAVDGVSLTVVSAQPASFTVSLIAYTQEHVTLLDKQPGDEVNIEVDVLAKYVERLAAGRAIGGSADKTASEKSPPAGLSLEFLAEHGFS